MMQSVKCVFAFLLLDLDREYSSCAISRYFNALPCFDMVLYFTLIDAQDSQL